MMSRGKFGFRVSGFGIFFLGICLSAFTTAPAAEGTAHGSPLAIPEIDEAALRRHVEKLAACGSRVPGYPGHDQATQYLRDEFKRLGYTDIQEDVFEVTVPVDEGSSVEIVESGRSFALSALWPNLVRTSQLPADGVTGLAVDGGGGQWDDFNGRDIHDSIVFIDFNSDSRWLNAAILGARAIVFVEPEQTVRRQAENKMATVPLNVPRFWIAADEYKAFAEAGFGHEVRLRCRMPWRSAPVHNLRVRLEGSDPSPTNRLVCIQAYYDSISVVPGVAPGAEAACGMAALLELARMVKEDPPPGPVLFLAVSGHHLRNAGIQDFMHRHSRKREPFRSAIADPIDPDLMLCLDLTSRNQTVGMTFTDRSNGPAINQYELLYTRGFLRHAGRFGSYAERASESLGRDVNDIFLNLVRPEGGGSWFAHLPEDITLDGTLALVGATPAISLVTTHDPRTAIDTPLDLPRDVNHHNLAAQVRFLGAAVRAGLRDEELLEPPKMNEDRLRLFRGRLVIFDPTKSFIPDEPVRGGLGRLMAGDLEIAGQPASRIGVRTASITLSNDEGWFEVYAALEEDHSLEGYGLDPDNGDIVLALDRGLEGIQQFPVNFDFNTFVKERSAVLFHCRGTDLFDIVDPRYLIPMDKLLLYDAGNVEPFAYGYTLNRSKANDRTSDASPYATIFAKAGLPLKIGVSSDILGQRMLFLNAPSAEKKKEAEGLGYPVGESRSIEVAPFSVLKDMHHLDAYRMELIRRYGIENRRLERLHAAAGDALDQAEEAAAEKQWGRFITFARRGLGIESRAYPDVTATANDVVKGIVFYMALMVPFAFFCERLFFAFTRFKHRIAAFTMIFLVTYLALRLVHPAFRLVETSEVILLGLIILVLSGIVVFISSTQFEAQMRALKREIGRVHETDVSRASAIGTAFSLGISNMRRRRVRTFLTCTAIVLLMFTVLSFTSVKTYLRPRLLPRPNAPAYEGALIRDRTWRPIPYLALDHIQSEFSETGVLARRSWLYPRYVSETFTRLAIQLRSTTDEGFGTERIRAFGLVGMDPDEGEVSGVDRLLSAGRWFEPGDREVCILPDTMAQTLGITADDAGTAQVHLLGMRATVIGLMDMAQFNDYRDLDNERPTPIDFTMLSRESLEKARQGELDVSNVEGRGALETFQHLDAENVLLMPYETVLDVGGSLQSVALAFPGGNVGEQVKRFLDRLAVTVFVGEKDKVTVYSSLASSSVGGMGNIIVPVLIAALMVLNTMSGSVHERLREIGTYSAVGLAPIHIGALFVAEACVFAILGGIAGYVIGQLVTKGLALMGGLGGLTLNYSSLASVFATIVVMLTVLISTLYPARMASRMAVPDVTRRWRLPDPKGDDWQFDFPFTVSGKEVTGLYVFFRYYFASFEEQSVGRFYTTRTELSRFEEDGQQGYRLLMRVWLSPYDLGVSQDVDMRAVPSGDFGVYQIRLAIRRLSGQSSTWVRINRGFLNEIRKQFLLWRTVAPETKTEYVDEAEEVFG